MCVGVSRSVLLLQHGAQHDIRPDSVAREGVRGPAEDSLSVLPDRQLVVLQGKPTFGFEIVESVGFVHL